MKYPKWSRKIFTFLFVALGIFGVSERKIFAADPTTKAECEALPSGNCQKENSSSFNCNQGETQKGKCGDDGAKPVCCVADELCGDNNQGACRYADIGGCLKDEKILNTCPNKFLRPRNCCVKSSEKAVPNDDSGCIKSCKGAICKASTITGSDPCATIPNFKANGTCDSAEGLLNKVTGIQVCCIPDSCKPTPVGASGPGPTAGLNYEPLENIPGFEGQGGDFPTYLKNLYLFALWIVALSALFMLTVGGFLYLSSAGNTHLIGNAKKTIYAALVGLILALLSWLLLDTINSDLTNLKLSGLSVSGSGAGGSGGGGGPSTPPSGNADPEGCKKLKNLASGISDQCNLVSKELAAMMVCAEEKGLKGTWTSISARAVGGDQNKAIACCGNGHTGGCPHSSVTCHHGCTFGTKGLSYAVDIGGLTAGSSDESLCAAANIIKACGGGNIWGPRTLSCGIKKEDGHNDHLHASVGGCPH